MNPEVNFEITMTVRWNDAERTILTEALESPFNSESFYAEKHDYNESELIHISSELFKMVQRDVEEKEEVEKVYQKVNILIEDLQALKEEAEKLPRNPGVVNY